jgi:precorrin-6B C5,15-methyltransferase / cobalt-precorrin-6B C5,C15-methyltransferase
MTDERLNRMPVTIIGLGMSPDDLTETQMELIRQADILMGGKRHLAYFKELSLEKKEVTKDIKGAIAFIRDRMEDRQIVVLASGDPLFFGIGSLIIRDIGADKVAVYPNVSAVAAAFAKIKQPWSRAKVISLHGREREFELLRQLQNDDPVAVFTDLVKTPAWIAEFLISRGLDDVEMCVAENLGSEKERIGWFRPDQAAKARFDELNVVILKRGKSGKNAQEGLRLGMPEDAFQHEGGLITKTEVRVVSLAKLKLQPGLVLWDLGAGSGSVGIEASLLLPGGRIIAVEKKTERVAQIQSNIRSFGVTNMEVVQAQLPNGLEDLPTPDRIFIGGGGKGLSEIIATSASHLKPGGVMVANTVLLANLDGAVAAMRKVGFETEVIQIQIQRSKPMPWSERFEAQSPVWIITGTMGN